MTEPVAVEPERPLYAFTTAELIRRRRDLEHAIKTIAADAPVQADLRKALQEVLDEEEDRVRIARAR